MNKSKHNYRFFYGVIMVLLSLNLNAQCLPDGIVLSSQSEIDNFSINYPDCTDIIGGVIIHGANPNSITSLNGLSQIINIAGNLDILGNDSLLELTGLENLTSIGGDFEIDGCNQLSNLSGINNLTNIDGTLEIFESNNITSLFGLESITSLSGLWIDDCPLLSDISKLINITTYNSDVAIEYCDSLLNLSGLNNITTINGTLTFNGCSSISNLSELSNLISLNGYLAIFNTGLINLDGLDSLDILNGSIIISENENLTNLSGISNINPNSILPNDLGLPDLVITNNPLLSLCAVQSICDFFDLPDGTTVIQNNYSGCNSVIEIENECENLSINNEIELSQIKIKPNPSNNVVVFSITDNTNIELYSVFGKIVKKTNLSRTNNTLDISELENGIYFCRFQNNDFKKIIKK